MGLIIEEDVLLNANMSPEDLRIEIAVHLYNIGKLSLGQARNMVGLDQISFQQEMAKRDVLIKYGHEDFMDDLDSIKAYKKMK
jgi:predicted HTH domain antitoxin